MAIFRFTITRDVTQSKVCRIEAPTIEAAHELACSSLNVATGGWEVDDLPTHCEPYIPDENDYEVISNETP